MADLESAPSELGKVSHLERAQVLVLFVVASKHIIVFPFDFSKSRSYSMFLHTRHQYPSVAFDVKVFTLGERSVEVASSCCYYSQSSNGKRKAMSGLDDSFESNELSLLLNQVDLR